MTPATSVAVPETIAADDPTPAGAGQQTAGDAHRGRQQVRLVCGMLLAVVLLQRIAVPLGSVNQVPLLVVVALGVAVIGYGMGLLRWDSERGALVLLGLGACAFTGALALARGLVDASLLSLEYLLLTYAIFMVVLHDPPEWVLGQCLRFLTRLGTIIGLLAIVQMTLQTVGVAYSDPLAKVIPEGFLLRGFNTAYPIIFGSPLYKANAWVFLEPSFCSQFLAVAFVAALACRAPRRYLVIMAAGIVCTVAGTGVALLLVGLVAVTLRNGIRVLRPLVVPVLVALLVGASTPLGGVLASRVTETGQANSSGSLRFIQPFQVLGTAWMRDVSTMLLGAGPGASERLAIRLAGSTVLQQPVPLKLLVDYGAPAAVVFLGCLLWVVIARAPVPGLTAGLVAAWLILNSALLLPAVVTLVWTLTSLMSTTSDRLAGPTAAARPNLPSPRSRQPTGATGEVVSRA